MRKLILIGSTVALACSAAILTVGTAHVASPYDPPGPMDSLAVDLAQLKLTPEAVSASGLHGSLSTILERMGDATTIRASLHAKREALAVAAADVESLEDRMAGSAADEGLIEEHATAVSLLATLKSDLAGLEQQLWAEVTDGLPGTPILRANVYRDNFAYRVPPEFRVKTMTASQWDAVQSALIAEARAARLGKELDSVQAELLQGLRTDEEVAAAASDLQGTLAADKAAIEAAIAGE